MALYLDKPMPRSRDGSSCFPECCHRCRMCMPECGTRAGYAEKDYCINCGAGMPGAPEQTSKPKNLTPEPISAMLEKRLRKLVETDYESSEAEIATALNNYMAAKSLEL